MKTLVILADNFEEIEAFTVIDVLRRAGIDVTVAGLVSTVVVGAHGVRTIADKRLGEINTDKFDAMVLPGGPAYKAFLNSQAVINLLKDFDKKKKFIGAICASPSVLAKAGILDERIATIYPGMEGDIKKPRNEKVVIDGHIITSRSPGTAIEFSLKLAEIFSGKNTAEKVEKSLEI